MPFFLCFYLVISSYHICHLEIEAANFVFEHQTAHTAHRFYLLHQHLLAVLDIDTSNRFAIQALSTQIVVKGVVMFINRG